MSEFSENDKRCDECCDGDEGGGLLKDAAVILASTVVILGGIHYCRAILGPILLAAFFAAMLTSPMRWLRSRGWSQTASLTTVILFVMLIGGGTITVVGSQLKQFAQDVPEYRDRFNEELAKYNLEIGDFVPFLKDEKKEEQPKEDKEKKEENQEPSLAVKQCVREEVDRLWLEKWEQSRQESEKKNDATDSNETLRNLKTNVSPIMQVACQDVEPNFEATAELTSEIQEPAEAFSPIGGELSPLFEAEDAELGVVALEGETQESEETSPDGVAEEEEAAENGGVAPKPVVKKVDEAPTNTVEAASNELFSYLAQLASELSYLASNSFLVTLLVIFMLCETTTMPKKMTAALGKRSFVNEHIQQIVGDIRNYMVIKTWMSLGVGTCVTFLLLISDVQYPLLWGFVAFLLNYIPNIGSVVAAIPPIVLATVEHGVVVGGIDAVFFAIINCTIGYAIEPRLLGNGLDLSPLIVLLALILFGWLLGPIGMFLSPPLAVIMKIIFQSFPETRWIAVLMANRPPKNDGDADKNEGSGAKIGARA
ncbi:MAG: AI-2E family transporter [Thermoguttaceae bacterium]|nr:AI-2E family transporter [Thermoguttaceae bacterium]